jgi:hypothetical protein
MVVMSQPCGNGAQPILPPGDEPSGAGALSETPARLIVCGGRDFHDYYRLANVMDRLRAIRPIAMVFHGNARGADTLADRWCRERGVKVFPVPAQWAKHGKRAGPLRNRAMLGQGIDLVVAFPGGRGTEDMVKQAHAAGVMVTRARPAPLSAHDTSSATDPLRDADT